MELSKNQVALASDAWEALMRAYTAMEKVLKQDDAFREVTFREYDVLYTLAKEKRPLTQAEILVAAALSQPGVSRMLGRLEERGLIERDSCPGDGRSTLLSLTEKGVKIQREVGRAHGKNIAEYMWGALDGPQLAELENLCTRLRT